MVERIEKTLLEATLCFLVDGGRVLLAMKTKKIGVGCWNGYGGGIEPGESPEQAAVRELAEESGGITVASGDLEKVAVLDMENHRSDGGVFSCRVHVYLVHRWSGAAAETEEMKTPTWFGFDEVQRLRLMPADKVWLPLVLQGRKLMVQATYAPYQASLIGEVRIQDVENFER